ncbi:hypothetical protein [Sulfobacillus thermotolerans]|uniref:hypothetical protein n=1 Tax=Sulfobacillus thermotolerans TaxID=338644 RepID=UPI0033686D17
MDHNCRIGYDFANRSIAQCANRRIQSNHQQSQYDPVRRVQDRQGNSFIQMPLRTMSFLDEKGTLTATVQMTVALPIIAGPWNMVTTQGSVSIT